MPPVVSQIGVEKIDMPATEPGPMLTSGKAMMSSRAPTSTTRMATQLNLR